MKKFFILEPSPIFRYGLTALINSIEECNVVAEANNMEALKLHSPFPDNTFFLLNLDNEDSDVHHHIKQIKDADNKIKIIGFSNFQNKERLIAITKSGINGILGKSCDTQELANAIEMIHLGQDYFTKTMVELIIQNYSKSNPEIKQLIKRQSEQFTNREIEIIKLICKQKTAKEIGKLIFVCEKTVDFHRQKIIEKMNVRNIIGLVVYALKNEIINMDEV